MSKSNSQKFVSLDGKADRNYFSTNETLVNSSLKVVLRVKVTLEFKLEPQDISHEILPTGP